MKRIIRHKTSYEHFQERVQARHTVIIPLVIVVVSLIFVLWYASVT